jgi:hypothetical protein
LLAQSEVQIAFDEAAFRPINRGTTNRDSIPDRIVADPGIGSQQDLRPLELSPRMLPTAQQRRELCAFRLPQFNPVRYIHPWPPFFRGLR